MIKLKPSTTKRIDPKKIAEALGAEEIATLKSTSSIERTREGLEIYFRRRKKERNDR